MRRNDSEIVRPLANTEASTRPRSRPLERGRCGPCRVSCLCRAGTASRQRFTWKLPALNRREVRAQFPSSTDPAQHGLFQDRDLVRRRPTMATSEFPRTQSTIRSRSAALPRDVRREIEAVLSSAHTTWRRLSFPSPVPIRPRRNKRLVGLCSCLCPTATRPPAMNPRPREQIGNWREVYRPIMSYRAIPTDIGRSDVQYHRFGTVSFDGKPDLRRRMCEWLRRHGGPHTSPRPKTRSGDGLRNGTPAVFRIVRRCPEYQGTDLLCRPSALDYLRSRDVSVAAKCRRCKLLQPRPNKRRRMTSKGS